MNKNKHSISLLVLAILFAATAGFFVMKAYQKPPSPQGATDLSKKSLAFTKLFIDKVLQSKGEVNFDDRLKLENDIRALNDPLVFEHWKKFTNAKNSEEAQLHAKELLRILIHNIVI